MVYFYCFLSKTFLCNSSTTISTDNLEDRISISYYSVTFSFYFAFRIKGSENLKATTHTLEIELNCRMLTHTKTDITNFKEILMIEANSPVVRVNRWWKINGDLWLWSQRKTQNKYCTVEITRLLEEAPIRV